MSNESNKCPHLIKQSAASIFCKGFSERLESIQMDFQTTKDRTNHMNRYCLNNNFLYCPLLSACKK